MSTRVCVNACIHSYESFLYLLSRYVVCVYSYELYAVVLHSGISLSSGHYITYVRAPSGVAGSLPNQTNKSNGFSEQTGSLLKRGLQLISPMKDEMQENLMLEPGMQTSPLLLNGMQTGLLLQNRLHLKSAGPASPLLENGATASPICRTLQTGLPLKNEEQTSLLEENQLINVPVTADVRLSIFCLPCDILTYKKTVIFV